MTLMRNIAVGAVIAALMGAAACVTINVYFPAAAAEQAADKIIEEVWGDDAGSKAQGSRRTQVPSWTARSTSHGCWSTG